MELQRESRISGAGERIGVNPNPVHPGQQGGCAGLVLVAFEARLKGVISRLGGREWDLIMRFICRSIEKIR